MANHELTDFRPIALGTVRKGATEEIRFTAETYKGHEIINARVWDRDADGEYRPGKQGLAFRSELLGKVLAALGEARTVVRDD